MTREEELDWLYRLRSEIYVYMPREWLIPMNNALDMAIKNALEQEKIGHWKRIGYDIYECSICGQNVQTGDICAYKHCHGCDAHMKDGE